MTTIRTLLLILLFPLTTFAHPLLIQPQQIADGEVALLRWNDPCPEQLSISFNGHKFFVPNTPNGCSTLLGVPLGTPSGNLQVVVETKEADGTIRTFSSQLKVIQTRRPEERLTLPPAMVSPQDPKIIARIQKDQERLNQLFNVNTVPRWKSFFPPVPDAIGSVFGLRRILNDQPRSPHGGLDFRSPAGRSIQAAASGRVVLADDLYFTGNTIILDHGGELFSIYAHLEKILCQTGDEVESGTAIGHVGKTGRASGPHLHWGIRLRGDRIDPQAVLRLFQGKEKP